MGGQKTVGKTLPPKTGPKTPFTADAAASQIARQRLGSLAADHEGEGITAMKMMSLFDGSGGFPLAEAISVKTLHQMMKCRCRGAAGP